MAKQIQSIVVVVDNPTLKLIAVEEKRLAKLHPTKCQFRSAAIRELLKLGSEARQSLKPENDKT